MKANFTVFILLTVIAASKPVAEAADLMWLQTSRVFLIDAYQYPFAPKLEFDAEEIAQTMADMHANVVRMSTMGKYCTIQGARFSRHPDQGRRDLLAEMIAACKPRGIKVVPYISTGHKLAWSMVTRDYPEYAHHPAPGAPPLRSTMYIGEDHGTVCWNTPYRKAYLELVEHVVRDYDIDGMYFDSWLARYFWGDAVCYCDGCREGFRKATGLEIPYPAKTAADLETIARYKAWYQEQLIEVLHEVRRIVKSHKDIPMICNIENPRRIASDDRRILAGLDAFLYERGESMQARAEGVSLARAAGMYVWPYVGVYHNWPRIVYQGLDYQQEIFTTAAFGGGCVVAQPNGFVKYKDNREIVRYPFGVLERNEDSFRGFANLPYVAVVYDGKGSAARGAFAACLHGHIQAACVLDRILDDPEKLGRYKVLYLAGDCPLSSQRVENVRQFVHRGGGLLVSGTTSLLESKAGREIVHVRSAPEIEVGNFTAMQEGPNDVYVLGRTGELGDRWAARPLPAWNFGRVAPLEGCRVAADIVRGEGMKPVLPALLLSRCGEGRTAYLASALEELYQRENVRTLGEFLRDVIRAVSPNAVPYQVIGPECLTANMTEKGSRRVLHLVNWTGNKFERPHVCESYLAPVENIRIWLHAPPGKKIAAPRTLIAATMEVENRGSTCELRLPRVEAYQAVEFRID